MPHSCWLNLLFLIAFSSLNAQQTPGGCFDRGSRLIPTILNDSIPYAAAATLLENGDPVIYWNPGRHGDASPMARYLVYFHECAHHALGHVRKWLPVDMKREVEKEADCWAYQHMVEREQIAVIQMAALEEEIGRWSGDLIHQAGPLVVATLRECLALKTNPGLWHRFLDNLTNATLDSLASLLGDVIPESGDERVRESILNPPGTFGCDIRADRVLVCEIWNGVRATTARRRYGEIKSIIDRWLSSNWVRVERNQAAFEQPHLFLAWDRRTGANLSLVVTSAHRVFFTFSPLPPQPAGDP